MPANHAALTAGMIAASVAVAAAVAVYESPELQRMVTDLRRRIALALHSFGDVLSPQERENLFNRPEDAEGFLQSRGLSLPSGEEGVDADDETRRRQREELLYWNAVREEKNQKSSEAGAAEKRPHRSNSQGSTFDDFLKEDNQGEKGSFVFHSGAQVQDNSEGLIRRRGEGVRGLQHSVLTNPFTDEHGIDEHVAFENGLMEPSKEEILSDIYSATDLGEKGEASQISSLSPPVIPAAAALVDVNESQTLPHAPQPQPSERELGPTEYMTAGQEENEHDAYSSIQAWAQNSTNTGFYSPLPETPADVMSEPELVSDGQMTPTDSASLAGSGEDVGDAASENYDVLSDDGGIMTPASWTEVGSVSDESETDAVPA
jgi:hypothetical protein